MEKPSREEYTKRSAALGVDETYEYIEALEGYCDQLEKALDSSCTKLEGLCTVIDILTDKDTAHDKKYWKERLMKDA